MNTSYAKAIPVEYLIYKINIMKKAFLIIASVSLLMLFFSRKFSLGFFVGGLISMANFSLLAGYIAKMRSFALNRAKRYIISKFLVMYLVMAITLFIGATKGMVVFAGTALGLLVIKMAIFSDGALVKYAKPG